MSSDKEKMALIKHEPEQIKISQLYESTFPFRKKPRNIQINKTTDDLLMKFALSCKTSLHWEYKWDMEEK